MGATAFPSTSGNHSLTSSSSESDERVLLSRLSLFLRLNSSLRLDFTIKRNAFHFQSSLSSVRLERFARRDGLSAMAISVLVLMEDRQLCEFICAHSYFHFLLRRFTFHWCAFKTLLIIFAQGRVLLSRILYLIINVCANARLSVARFLFLNYVNYNCACIHFSVAHFGLFNCCAF